MKVYLIASGGKKAPLAPSSLTATAVSSSRINLAWTDNSTDEDGFKIERSLDGVNFTEITSVGAGVTTYASTGLSASTQYYYRVRAYRGSVNSAYSNTANATTTAVVTERIITIDTRNTESGSSASNQFNLAFQSGFGGTNFTVDWGDSTTDTVSSSVLTGILHTYATAGVYDIKITGSIKHNVSNATSADKRKYLDIKNWGTVTSPTTTQTSAFYGCVNMVISATDYPVFATGASLNGFFRGCTSLTNEDFSGWGVLRIAAYTAMFRDCSNFNGNVSNLVDPQSIGGSINSMFQGCVKFVGVGVDTWNVTNVTSLDTAFSQCTLFNGAVENWDVSNVTQFTSAFSGCTAFNRNLSLWDVGRGQGFGSMFNNSGFVNNTSIVNWNMGQNLTGTTAFSMFGMFQSTIFRTPNISSWNMIRCNSIQSMLTDGGNNNNLGTWDIRNVSSAGSFMATATPATLSAINLANMYIAWASQPVQPMTISFGTAKYDASGASARAVLTGARAVSVSNAGDPLANGVYTWNGTRYQNANGYYFINSSSVDGLHWRVRNPSNTTIASSAGSFPTQNTVQPATATGWSGAWSGMVITVTGAGWTITDGGQL